MKDVNVVIPIYNDQPTNCELESLYQCFEKLGKRDITFICGHTFDNSFYLACAQKFQIKVSVEKFENTFFLNVMGYNKLLLSAEFYKRFELYDYILIYQLDSFIFSDQITEWCSLKYDYVGAPWVGTSWLKEKKEKLMRQTLSSKSTIQSIISRFQWQLKGYHQVNSLSVGNGGLSLRKVNILCKICMRDSAAKSWTDNEDVFWSIYVPLNYKFDIPNLETAAEFSFDVNPSLLYKIIKSRLPMGCHGWGRDDFPYEGNNNFWKSALAIEK